MDDAPVKVDGKPAWLLDQLGNEFALVQYVATKDKKTETFRDFKDCDGILIHPVIVAESGVESALSKTGVPVLVDTEGWFQKRFDASDGTCYLIRPDQHVCARWRAFDPDAVQQALQKAIGN